MAPAAVDAAYLSLGAGQGQTLEVGPEGGGQEAVWTWQPTKVIVFSLVKRSRIIHNSAEDGLISNLCLHLIPSCGNVSI